MCSLTGETEREGQAGMETDEEEESGKRSVLKLLAAISVRIWQR